jgi:hypothetical protein
MNIKMKRLLSIILTMVYIHQSNIIYLQSIKGIITQTILKKESGIEIDIDKKKANLFYTNQ